jgi:hypothetical protein
MANCAALVSELRAMHKTRQERNPAQAEPLRLIIIININNDMEAWEIHLLVITLQKIR